jgi:tricorn protease
VLLRTPTVDATRIVFTYGGDLWAVARDGGEARRLTSAAESNSGPRFSPDGTLIASRV